MESSRRRNCCQAQSSRLTTPALRGLRKNTMIKTLITANQLQEGIFHLEAEIKEARADGDWDRVDYLGECLDADREALENMKVAA